MQPLKFEQHSVTDNPTTTMKTIVHTLKATHKDKTILGYQRYELVPVPLMRGETIDGKEYWSAFYFCDGQLTTDNGDIGMEASPGSVSVWPATPLGHA